jgi:uncharacterized protein (DUF58 family)
MNDCDAYYSPEIVGQIASAGLRVRTSVVGSISGLHRSPLHGVSPEFAEYRSYTPGDDLRNLDWRVYARSDRFHIKRYEEESNLRAYIVVDASASMNYRGDHGTKFHSAATLAVALAATLIRQRDAVGLVTFNTAGQNHLRLSSAESQLQKFRAAIASVTPRGETDPAAAISELADQVPRRGLVVLISDLLTELEPLFAAMKKVQYRGHEMLVFHVLDRDELELPFQGGVLFRDMEGTDELFAEPRAFRSAYRRAMRQFQDTVRDHCQLAGMDYLDLCTDDDLGGKVSLFLKRRAQGRLAT